MEKQDNSKIFLIAIIAIVVIVLISNNSSLTGEAARKATKSTTTNVAPRIYIDQTTYWDRKGTPQTTVYHGSNWNCMETRFGYGGTYQVGTYLTTNLARSLIKTGLIANEMVTKYGDTNWICMYMESHPQTNSPEWVVRFTRETSYEIRTSSRNEIPINSYNSQNNRLKYSRTSKTSEYYRTGK